MASLFETVGYKLAEGKGLRQGGFERIVEICGKGKDPTSREARKMGDLKPERGPGSHA
jgi:hypothetical protein